VRVGILDIGSNSVHLRVMDLNPGWPPEPADSMKRPVRLAEATSRRGVISAAGRRRVAAAAREARRVAAANGVDELVAFATSAVREAVNCDDVTAEITAAAGVPVVLLSGEDEARLTFLAARRWYGWSAGPMMLADIGGGSLEIGYGRGEAPSIAVSLPLGAGELTRQHLPAEPPVPKKDVTRLRRQVRSVLEEATAELREHPPAVTNVATSKTFSQLARLCGAPKRKAGAFAVRTLDRGALIKQIPKLAKATDAERARMRGVSASRAHQILAGAIAAEAVMRVLGVRCLNICPWGVREGIAMERLDRRHAA
jgi:exopolyphosphatase/guanosine-5'-triphosphate,3'-diphosphate pyrophosphatase